MNKFAILLSGFLCLAGAVSGQSLGQTTEQRLKDFFTSYETSYARIGKCKLERFEVEHEKGIACICQSGFWLSAVYGRKRVGYLPFVEAVATRTGELLYLAGVCRWQANLRPGA